MITNGQVINNLTDYFLKQDREMVARLLAAAMIDFNRVYHIRAIDEDEKKLLRKRIKFNIATLNKFIADGPHGDLTCGPMPKDENENDN